jgi:hypothetical protein
VELLLLIPDLVVVVLVVLQQQAGEVVVVLGVMWMGLSLLLQPHILMLLAHLVQVVELVQVEQPVAHLQPE